MFKVVLPLVISVSFANAATIGLNVNCGPDASYQYGPTSASCSQLPSGFTAHVEILANAAYQDSLGNGGFGGSPAVFAHTDPIHCLFCTDGASASGFFRDDYVLTITGGIGQGFFVPCMFAGEMFIGSGAESASASFGTLTVSANVQHPAGGSSCEGPDQIGLPLKPFTFGIPQTFTVSLSVQNAEGPFVGAYLWGFHFYDAFGVNQITTAHFTLVSTNLPELSSWSLLGIGMFFVAVPIRRTRQRERRSTETC